MASVTVSDAATGSTWTVRSRAGGRVVVVVGGGTVVVVVVGVVVETGEVAPTVD